MNFGQLVKSKWRKDVRSSIRGAIFGILTTQTIEDYYPDIEEEVDGVYRKYKKILPHQKVYHAKRSISGQLATRILFSGGVGAGKTLSLCVEILDMIKRCPGIVIVGVTGYDYYFQEFLRPMWDKVCDPDDKFILKYTDNDREWKFVNGSKMRWKAFDEPGKIKGWEANVIFIEEGSELGGGNPQKANAIFSALLMRLRAYAASVHVPRMILVNQNPAGYNWAYRLFVSKSPYKNNPKRTEIPACRYCRLNPSTGDYATGRVAEEVSNCQKTCVMDCKDYPKGTFWEEYEYISSDKQVWYTLSVPSSANSQLPAGYIDAMLSTIDDPEIIKRMVMGSFAPIHSLVFGPPLYQRSTHVVTLENVLNYYKLFETDDAFFPADWPLLVGIDLGGPLSPTAILFIVQAPDGVLFVIDEHYQKKMEWQDIVQIVDERMQGWEKVKIYGDPKSTRKQEGPRQETLQEEFRERGLNIEIPRYWNQRGGVMHIRSLLKRDTSVECPFLDDMIDEEKQEYEIGKAGLYFIEGACPYLLLEMDVWRYDGKKNRQATDQEEGLSTPVNEKTVDRDDHACSALMFGLWSLSTVTDRRRQTQRLQHKSSPRIRYKGRKKPGSR